MWVALVGTRETGRQGVARRLETAVRDAGHSVAGFHQEARWSENGVRQIHGYDLVDAATGQRHRLASKSKDADAEMCDWGFSADAFPVARAWLSRSASVRFAVAGRLEAAERGHWPAISDTMNNPGVLVLSIRPNVLASIALRLPDPVEVVELPATDVEVSEFILRVVDLVSTDS